MPFPVFIYRVISRSVPIETRCTCIRLSVRTHDTTEVTGVKGEQRVVLMGNDEAHGHEVKKRTSAVNLRYQQTRILNIVAPFQAMNMGSTAFHKAADAPYLMLVIRILYYTEFVNAPDVTIMGMRLLHVKCITMPCPSREQVAVGETNVGLERCFDRARWIRQSHCVA